MANGHGQWRTHVFLKGRAGAEIFIYVGIVRVSRMVDTDFWLPGNLTIFLAPLKNTSMEKSPNSPWVATLVIFM